MAALQETHLRQTQSNIYPISGYTWYRKNVGDTTHGGAAILISNKVIHREISINSPYHCVAVELKINHIKTTVVSLYIPCASDSICASDSAREQLQQIIAQLRPPYLVLADVNAHHPAWGSRSTTGRGEAIYDLLEENNLMLLNNGQATRQRSHTGQQDTAIDISFCTPRIHHLFDWDVGDNLSISDHNPIYLKLATGLITQSDQTVPRWNLKRAHWPEYQKLVEQKLEAAANVNMDTVTEAISSAAKASVPKTKRLRTKVSAPWWSPACQLAVAQRRRAQRQYQKCASDENLYLMKTAQIQCQNLITSEKQKAWQEKASEFNRFTPTGKIWQLMKMFHLQRPRQKPFPQLVSADGTSVTEPDQVVEEFAKHYTKISANYTYDAEVVNELNQLSRNCQFDSANDEIYNTPFTLQELRIALCKCGNTSVGPDDIHYAFFKNLTLRSAEHLLTAINDLFLNDTFPAQWRKSTVIPIPKPNKNHSEAKGYRPISLTSCSSKLVERMVNRRLKYHLESKGILDKFQCGFRRAHSTIDSLIRITSDLKNRFLNGPHCTQAVFLDITAAFDRVQKPALLYKIHQLGIRGHMAKFISNFLSNRTAEVRCGATTSGVYGQDQGLPQGAVLSPTLFLIMINDVFEDKIPRLNYSLFADDLAIWAGGRHLHQTVEIVQDGLDHISAWCQKWGFTLSAEKSKAVTFSHTNTQETAVVQLNGDTIQSADSARFLGVELDKRLSFSRHIKCVINKCKKRLNILRALSGTDWGGDRKTLLLLYKSIIRPIIEYGSFLYDQISPSQKLALEKVQNSAMRAATGALPRTRVHDLLADANMPTLQERRNQQLLRYTIQVRSDPTNPARDCLMKQHRFQNSKTGKRYAPVSKYVLETLVELRLELPLALPAPAPRPFWLSHPPKVEFLFNEKKSDIHPLEISARFSEYQSLNLHRKFIFTDGSKQADRVGFGLTGPVDYFRRLPNKTSIFSAEATAIWTAVKICISKTLTPATICSDSKSVLQAISNPDTDNWIVSDIQKFLSESNLDIIIVWVPGHAGILGNDKADALAKKSLELNDPFPMKFAISNAKSILAESLKNRRQELWTQASTPMLAIKPRLGPWATSHQKSRRREVALTRLRTGKVRFSIKYNPVSRESSTKICPYCRRNQTIRHVLIDCQTHEPHRGAIRQYCQNQNIDLSLPNLLGDNPEIIELVLQFLKDTDYLAEI